MEPNESPQTQFMLSRPSCGDADIFVTTPAHIFCFDGDFAVVRGSYLKPSEIIRMPILDFAQVECRISGSETDAPPHH